MHAEGINWFVSLGETKSLEWTNGHSKPKDSRNLTLSFPQLLMALWDMPSRKWIVRPVDGGLNVQVILSVHVLSVSVYAVAAVDFSQR